MQIITSLVLDFGSDFANVMQDFWRKSGYSLINGEFPVLAVPLEKFMPSPLHLIFL